MGYSLLQFLTVLTTAVASPDWLTKPLLFMTEQDCHDPWGLLYPVAPPLAPVTTGGGSAVSLDLGVGATLLAVFDPSPLRPGRGYEVFFTNVTGAPRGSPLLPPPPPPTAVFFGTTTDLTSGLTSTPVNVADIGVVPSSDPPLSCYPKTVGRSDDGTRSVRRSYSFNQYTTKPDDPGSLYSSQMRWRNHVQRPF
jgi:hypothetical protein